MAAVLVRTERIREVRERAEDGDRFARRAVADWLVGQRRIDEAIDEMRVVAGGGNFGACRRLARLLAGQGRIEEAIAQLERVPEPYRHESVPGWMGSYGVVARRPLGSCA